MTRTQALRMAKANKARKATRGVFRASPLVTRLRSDGQTEVFYNPARLRR